MATSLLPLLNLNSGNSIFAKLLILAQTMSTRVQEPDFLGLAPSISSDSRRELENYKHLGCTTQQTGSHRAGPQEICFVEVQTHINHVMEFYGGF